MVLNSCHEMCQLQALEKSVSVFVNLATKHTFMSCVARSIVVPDQFHCKASTVFHDTSFQRILTVDVGTCIVFANVVLASGTTMFQGQSWLKEISSPVELGGAGPTAKTTPWEPVCIAT